MEKLGIERYTLEKYKAGAMQTWQLTTKAYFEKYPEAEESLILKRYIEEFCKYCWRISNMYLYQIKSKCVCFKN